MPEDTPTRIGDAYAKLGFMAPHSNMPRFDVAAMARVTPLSHWLSGDAVFAALKKAVDDLKCAAPKDHDVLVQAFDISVVEVRYIEPHTLLLSGFNQEGNHTAVVAHFSQLVAHVVYLPKRGPERVVTGFWKENEKTG
jgi:hypothetical protein